MLAVSVLVSGPLPPPYGGMTIYCQDYLKTSLTSEFNIIFCKSNLINPGTQNRFARTFLKLINHACITAVLIVMLILKRPRIAHIHTNSYTGFYAKSFLVLVCRMCFVKTVLHIHGGGFKKFYNDSGGIARRIIRRLLKLNSKLLVLSNMWRDYFISIGIKTDRIEVIPNSVFLPELFRKDERSGRITILFLALFQKNKGIYELVDVIIRRRDLLNTCQFILAGPEKEEWHSIASLLSKSGLSKEVKMPGLVTGAAKEQLLKQSDIYVLPSFVEGLPIGLLEAMSYGLACIATSVGGIPDVIENGKDGLLIQPGDKDALEQAIEKLVRDEGLRLSLGQAARRKVELYYNWQGRTQELSQLYKKLIAC